MWNRLWKRVERLVSRLDFFAYAWAGFTAVSGFVTAHLASLNNWIASFGAIGYWSAGLLGALVVALIGAALARVRVWWITGSALDKWRQDVSAFNPLDDTFTKLRMRLL